MDRHKRCSCGEDTMSWEDILKIITEDAISDAKRFASKDVAQSSKDIILDVFKDEFTIQPQSESSGVEYIILDYKKDFDKLYNMRFFDGPFESLELRPARWTNRMAMPESSMRDGYVAIVPKGIHLDNHKLTFRDMPVFTPKDAEYVKRVYIHYWEKAEEIYKASKER